MLNKAIEFQFIKRNKVKRINVALMRKSGRNSKGMLVCFHKAGGHKRLYKVVDFFRILYNIPGIVLKFVYDASRNSYLALVLYKNGFISYIIAPSLLKEKDIIYSGLNIPYKLGSCMPLYKIPSSFFIHNVELNARKGSIFARSAGTSIQMLKKTDQFVLIRLPSKEERVISLKNWGVLGKVAFEHKKLIKKTKAGSLKSKGKKPVVRGVAKNPIDHPHGGGEGRTTAGQPSVSPWGIYTKGVRTTTRFKRITTYKWGFFRRRCNKVW